jgi:hypothetical protein
MRRGWECRSRSLLAGSARSGSRWPNASGAIITAAGLPVGAPMPAADRARARTEVAREFFLAKHGRERMEGSELAVACEAAQGRT